MRRRRNLLLAVAIILVAVIGYLLFPVLQPDGVPIWTSQVPELAETTNLALDVRFSYDPELVTPAPFDDRAEYPLQLDAETWSFYGKRIQGVGRMLAKAPEALLYDFVGSQHLESLEVWYGLEPVGKPLYEDVYLNGVLGLHQQIAYERTPSSRGWPAYFPAVITAGPAEEEPHSIGEVRSGSHIEERLSTDRGLDKAYIEGWALFTDRDLFFFQTISRDPLSAGARDACMAMMESLQFNVLLGSDTPAAQAPGTAKPEADGDAPDKDVETAPADQPETGQPE